MQTCNGKVPVEKWFPNSCQKREWFSMEDMDTIDNVSKSTTKKKAVRARKCYWDDFEEKWVLPNQGQGWWQKKEQTHYNLLQLY